MTAQFERPAPSIIAPLDPDFRPPALANQAFTQSLAAAGGGIPLIIGLERPSGAVSRYEIRVLPPSHPRARANFPYVERIVKFLLWQRGGCTLYMGGPADVGNHVAQCYAPDGRRAFDAHILGEDIYTQSFTVIKCSPGDVPAEKEPTTSLGRHLEGCRIGFDLGASDRKVSAVIDGEAVYSEEVVWEPRKHSDPEYHYREVMAALRSAASKLPRVDAIGGSSAGVWRNNRPMIASLFRGIPRERFGEIREVFARIEREFGVPMTIVNDGEVTALAGSMSLEANAVLGIALGSSEAGGYVTPDGNITDWLNELAFCPCDYNPEAVDEEWSGDIGVGARYFSQQCVFRLAPRAGIALPEGEGVTDAERLKAVQEKLEAGDPGAMDIWKTMGVYLGYTLAHYAAFYALEHVLVLGRCTSGSGGPILVDGARAVLDREFPELAARIQVQLPDEKARRVGQSIAAASLPELPR
jgi:predicted NBD/HSP70 family sugar kinase